VYLFQNFSVFFFSKTDRHFKTETASTQLNNFQFCLGEYFEIFHGKPVQFGTMALDAVICIWRSGGGANYTRPSIFYSQINACGLQPNKLIACDFSRA